MDASRVVISRSINLDRTTNRNKNSQEIRLKLSFSGLYAASLHSFSIPVPARTSEGNDINATITLRAIPIARAYDVSSHSNGNIIRQQSAKIVGRIRNGRAIFDNLNIILAPDYPDRVDLVNRWKKIRFQEYELRINSPGMDLSSIGQPELAITNSENQMPVDIIFR